MVEGICIILVCLLFPTIWIIVEYYKKVPTNEELEKELEKEQDQWTEYVKNLEEETKKDYDRWIDGSFEEFVKTDPHITKSMPLGQDKFRHTVSISMLGYYGYNRKDRIEVFVDHNGIIYELTYPTFLNLD